MGSVSWTFLNDLFAYKPVEVSDTEMKMAQILRSDSSKRLGMRHDRSSASASIFSGKGASIAGMNSYKLPSFCSHTFEAGSRVRGYLATHFSRTHPSIKHYYIGRYNWTILYSSLSSDPQLMF